MKERIDQKFLIFLKNNALNLLKENYIIPFEADKKTIKVAIPDASKFSLIQYELVLNGRSSLFWKIEFGNMSSLPRSNDHTTNGFEQS